MMTRGQLGYLKVVSQATIPKIASEMAAMMIMIFIEYPNSLISVNVYSLPIIIVIFMTHKTYKFILQIGVT